MRRSHHKSEGGVLPCLFDRIIRSLGRGQAGDSRTINTRGYRDAIRRDLEWLLNSNRRLRNEELDWAAMGVAGQQTGSVYDHEELPTSVLNYGIRDFNGTAVSPNDERVVEGIRAEIRNAIRQFEPRIVYESLKIEPIEDESQASVLIFSIEAELWALPEWESLRIDIDLNTGTCQVKGGGGP